MTPPARLELSCSSCTLPACSIVPPEIPPVLVPLMKSGARLLGMQAGGRGDLAAMATSNPALISSALELLCSSCASSQEPARAISQADGE